MQPTQEKDLHSKIGPIIGSLIVVIMLVVAALYMWGQHLNTQEQRQQEIQNLTSSNGQTIVIPIQSTSTDTSAIQQDLNSSPDVTNPNFKN